MPPETIERGSSDASRAEIKLSCQITGARLYPVTKLRKHVEETKALLVRIHQVFSLLLCSTNGRGLGICIPEMSSGYHIWLFLWGGLI